MIEMVFPNTMVHKLINFFQKGKRKRFKYNHQSNLLPSCKKKKSNLLPSVLSVSLQPSLPHSHTSNEKPKKKASF